MVGRSRELAEIGTFLDDDTVRALLLEGEAGIGKSTLLRAGLALASERGHAVLCAQPVAPESRLTLAGLRDLLRQVPSSVREPLPEIQRRALAVALVEEDDSLSIDRGVLGVAVLGLLREFASTQPVLLAIDDLQWLDESSGSVVAYVVRRLPATNVRLLASWRGPRGGALPFDLERWLDERSLRRVALEPLSKGAIRRLLRIRLGLDVTRQQLHAIHSATSGNPFFALELGRGGFVVDDDGLLLLPTSLQQLVGARLATLPRSTRDALLYVAALSDPTADALHRLGACKALAPAVDAEFLTRIDGRFRFAHPLLGAAAWSSADRLQQLEVHRTIAKAVDDFEEGARHLAATVEAPNAAVEQMLEEAGAAALRRGAPSGAADLLDRALEFAPVDDSGTFARLAATAAVAHAAAGHWDKVDELVKLAQDRLPAGVERATILVTAAEMRPGLEPLLHQAVDEAGDSPAGVRALIGLAEQAGLGGRWQEAVDDAVRAAGVARVIGDRGLMGVALACVGGAKHLDSRPEGWHELTQALAIERELGSLPASTFQSPRVWKAIGLAWQDQPEEARGLIEECLALARDRGDDMSAFQLMQLLLLVQLRSGDLPGARSTAETALDLVDLLGYDFGRAVLQCGLSRIKGHEGDLHGARRLATEAIEVLTPFGDQLWSTFALGSLVFADLCAHDTVAAIGHAEAIKARFPEGRESWWTYHQGDEIEALVLADELERADARVDELRTAGRALGLPRFLAWSARGEGLLHAARGDLKTARVRLEIALDEHRRFCNPLERGRTLLSYGNVLRRQLHRRAARTALEEALSIFDRIGARHFVIDTRDELKHVGGRVPAGDHELTAAEGRVAELVASGLSNREVARRLYVSVSTVEATLTRVYRKLGLHSRTQLVGSRVAPPQPTKTGAANR